jgi:hypothetical protein
MSWYGGMVPKPARTKVTFEPLAVQPKRLGALPEYAVAVLVDESARYPTEEDAQKAADRLAEHFKDMPR